MNFDLNINMLRFIRAPQFLFCVGAAIIFILMLPREAGCYLNYWITPWGRMTVLFASSVLLWFKHPLAKLPSMALSATAFSLTAEGIYVGWEEFVIVTNYWFTESGAFGVAWFLWKEIVVIVFSLLLFCYAASLIARAIIRRRYV